MTTRVGVLSANLGRYDRQVDWPQFVAPPGVSIEICRLTDGNLPPRPLAMTSRLQCGIPKMDGPSFLPGKDVYLWCDASCVPAPTFVEWWLDRLGRHELAVFQHPDRTTIAEEAAFMRERMQRPGETYLNSRYRGEWLMELVEHITRAPCYVDNALYASTSFAYRPTPAVLAMLKDWFWSKCRFCLHDQIYWPYTIWRHAIDLVVVPDKYTACEALTYVRNKKGKVA